MIFFKKPLPIRKYFWSFIFTYILTNLFLLTACQTVEKYQPPQQITNTPTITVPTAIILYASDTPNEFTYFSTFFTDRINKEKIFRARHPHTINEMWLKNSDGFTKKNDVEFQLHQLIKNFKNNPNKKNKFDPHFYELMANNPQEINPHLLSELFFWAARAKIKNALFLYQKYATVSERNLFESEVDPKIVQYLHSEDKAEQKTLKIVSKGKCLIYINGFRIQGMSVILPINLKSIVSASCVEGNFSKIFIPANSQSILIDTFTATKQIDKMPSLAALPKIHIQQENVDKVILVFWSKEFSALEAKILDGKSLKEIQKVSYKVPNQMEFDSVGDRLILFLQ